MVHLNSTITDSHAQWLRDQAVLHSSRLDAEISVSQVVRACIRYTHRAVTAGELTAAEWDGLLQ